MKLKFQFVRVVSEIFKKALKVQILNEVALRKVVRKRVNIKQEESQSLKVNPQDIDLSKRKKVKTSLLLKLFEKGMSVRPQPGLDIGE